MNTSPITVWTAERIVAITDGDRYGQDFKATQVSTDTRRINAGDLFIALDGPNFKGSDFVAQAKEEGAVAAIVNNFQAVDLPQIVVKDTLVALGQLAKAWRLKSPAIIFGLTGTNGKTTTKEMLKIMLQYSGETLATIGNLNNDIGVPLTLLRITPAHKYAVIEMGANHCGEIAYLTDIAQPDIVAITNVSAAHLEGFGSYDAVVTTKTEIYTHSHGPMVINLDMPCAQEWLRMFPTRPVTTFSLTKPADVMATEISDDGCNFSLIINEQKRSVKWSLNGVHNIANALTTCAMAKCAGIDINTMARALNGLTLSQARLSPHQLGVHRIYDDTYNANPASFKVAIDVIKTQSNSVVIAGDMGELGRDAASLHQQVAQYAKDAGIDEFWAIGEFAEAYKRGFGQAKIFSDFDTLAAMLNKLLTQTKPVTVLIKGSRSARMERLLSVSRLDKKIKEMT